MRSKIDSRPRNTCKVCEIEYHKKYAKNNPDKIKAIDQTYRAKNPEKVQMRKEKYQLENRELILVRKRKNYLKNKESIIYKQTAYIKNNPEIRKVTKANNKARKLSAEGIITLEEVKNLYLSQDGKCNICKVELNNYYQIDHKIPFTKNGSNFIENIQITCTTCNIKKFNHTPEQYEHLQRLLKSVEHGVTKLCRKCLTVKTIAEFHKDASSKDGLKRLCKTCKAKEFFKYQQK